MIVKVVVPDSIYARVYFARGEQGAQGPTGNTGPQGPSGIVNVDSPITNSGTSTAANIGINQALLQLAPAQVTGTAVITTDPRLSDQRVPTDGSVTDTKIVAGGLSPNRVAGTAVITTDSRLSDARTPLAHASTHGSAGSDPVTVAQSQVTGLTSALAAKAPLDSPVFTTKVTIPFSSTFLQSTGTGELRAVASAPGLGYIPYTASVTTGIAWQALSELVRTNVANIITSPADASVPLQLRRFSATATANIQEWDDQSGNLLASVDASGRGIFPTVLAGAFNTPQGAHVALQTTSATNKGIIVRGAASQSATLQEWQNSAGTVLASVNSIGSITFSTSGSLLSGSNGRGLFITSDASVSPMTVRGAASQSANLQEWQSSAGNILASVDSSGQIRTFAVLNPNSFNNSRLRIQDTGLTVDTGLAGNVPLTVATTNANPTGNLTEWKNSAGTVLAMITSGGFLRAERVATWNQFGFISERNSGGEVTMTRQTAATTNPGANLARLYFRDGTNAGTLKLVVRAGAAGAETTILDNIPT